MPRALSLIIGLAFLSFAALQYNDPDWYLWAPLYLIPTALAFSAFKGRYPVVPAAIAFVGFVAFTIYWLPGSLDTFSFDVEEWREVLGAELCALWCLTIAVAGRVYNKGELERQVRHTVGGSVKTRLHEQTH